MGRNARVALSRQWTVGASGAALAYAVGASFTRPFTVAADIVIAVPLAAAVVVTARWMRVTRRTDGGEAEDGGRYPEPARTGIVWIGPVIAVTAWELYCYANLPRFEHPTLSTLIDSLDSTRVGKTAAVAAWLALGWFLAAR